MSVKNDDGITIPSVFVGETTGKILIMNYQYQDGFVLLINDELPFNINTHLILPFSIVVGLCFIIMIGFMIVKCVREQRRLRRHRLPSSVLKTIPTIKFNKGHPYEVCVICLDEYIEGDKLRVLPCAHAYHCKCIDQWLTKNRRFCPICKRKVLPRRQPRQRRSSNDSTSDSEQDANDSTPLINPVEHGNSHGTFNQSANEGECLISLLKKMLRKEILFLYSRRCTWECQSTCESIRQITKSSTKYFESKRKFNIMGTNAQVKSANFNK